MAGLTEEKKQDIRDAWKSGQYVSHRQLAKAVGVHRSTVDNVLDGVSGPAKETAPVLTETSEMSGDEWRIALPKTRISTLEELLEFCKADMTIWAVERWSCNKWEAAGKNDDGKMVAEPLFQVKATLKRKVHIADAKAEIEALRHKAQAEAPTPIRDFIHHTGDGVMLEFNCPDLHAGKLAWGKETGEANYDTDIAVSLFDKALEALIARTRAHKAAQILFVIGNDLLNSDDVEGRTTGGTHVTTDGRYQKTFSAVRNMKVNAIERLRQIAPVKAVMVGGNHDWLSNWHLGDSLSCYFHKYKDVEIDNSPLFRKFHQFGRVMLMLTHGHKGKKNDYPLTMATQAPEMFGATKFREAHIGHIHQTRLEEQHGVRVRTLSALCPADDWHALNNFTGNLRCAETFVWDRSEGLIGTAIFTEVE